MARAWLATAHQIVGAHRPHLSVHPDLPEQTVLDNCWWRALSASASWPSSPGPACPEEARARGGADLLALGLERQGRQLAKTRLPAISAG